MGKFLRPPLLAALAGAALLTGCVGLPATPLAASRLEDRPRAERPTYGVGEKWYRNDGIYELTRIDGDVYVFETPGGDNEVHLTKNLALALVRKGKHFVEFDPPPKISWPLEVGKSGTAGGTWRWTENPSGVSSTFWWSVEAYEDFKLPSGGTVKAFRVHVQLVQSTGYRTVLQMWYAPEAGQLVKATGARLPLETFETVWIKQPAPAPLQTVQAPLSFPEDINVLIGRWDGEVHVPNDPFGPKRTLIIQTIQRAGEAWQAEGRYGTGANPQLLIETAIALDSGRPVVKFLTNYKSRLDLTLKTPDTLDGTFELYPGTGPRVVLPITLRRPTVPRTRLDLRAPAGAQLMVAGANNSFQRLQIDDSGFVRIFLEPGSHDLVVTKDGFEPWTQTLSVEPNDTRLERTADLAVSSSVATAGVTTPGPAEVVSLEITGAAGARVRVGDQDHAVDEHGAVTLRLAPGRYAVEVTKDGYRTWRATVTLTKDENPVTRQITLIPIVPPSIALLDPKPGATLMTSIARLKIEVRSPVRVTSLGVRLGGETAQLVYAPTGPVKPGDPWTVDAMAILAMGPNTIRLEAVDEDGVRAETSIVVTRQPVVAASPTADPVHIVPSAPRVADRWAVVIGVGEYDSRQIPRLRYATRDADAMYEFLTKSAGYAKDHVLLLTDTSQTKPTLRNIKRALGDFLARRAGRDDMVLIYFAGHGAPEVDVAGAESDGLSKYLVPQDGDPDSLYTSALPMDEIQRIFGRIQAERILLLLDTCYSGTAGGRSFARQRVRAAGLNDQFLERLTRSRGRVIITASGPNEVAFELDELGHGVFTYYVLEGLQGKADRNGDGIVTVSELYEYVEDQVDHAARRAGGRQRPLMKGEIEGTLPLSKVGAR